MPDLIRPFAIDGLFIAPNCYTRLDLASYILQIMRPFTSVSVPKVISVTPEPIGHLKNALRQGLTSFTLTVVGIFSMFS